MRSKFFTLATSSLLFSLAIAAVVYGQEESPPAATPAPTAAPGYLRFWNMLPTASGPLDLRRAGSKPIDPPLVGNSPPYRYSSYLDYPAAAYHLSVNRSGHPDQLLKTLDLNLAGNFFFTILVSPTQQGSSVQLINDTADPKATSATLTVRNYFPDVLVDVFDRGKKIVSALPYGQSFAVTGLPFENLSLSVRTILPNKVAAESGAEAEFKIAKRATLLVIPDEYGRFRPRLTLDGKNL
jgi:hypothetical protein